MWPNNGFGGNGHFQPNFNQDDFQQAPFNGGPDQQLPVQPRFFPHPSNMMQFEEMNSDSFMANNFQPEVGLFNEGAFMHNQFNQQFSPNQFIPPQVPASTTPRPLAQLDARAAELKAKLLKRQEERTSSVASAAGIASISAKQIPRLDIPSALRDSPTTPVTAEDKREQELNVNELISQYSDSKPTADASVKQNKLLDKPTLVNTQSVQRHDLPAKPQTPLLGSPTKVTMKPLGTGKEPTTVTNGKTSVNRRISNGSDVSEGEILEDVAPQKPAPPTKPKEAQYNNKATKHNDPPPRTAREDQKSKPIQNRASRDEPPQRSAPIIVKGQRNYDDRRQEPEPREYSSNDSTNDRKLQPRSEKQPYPRQDFRDDDRRRFEPQNDTGRRELSRQGREQMPPTLNDLLPFDDKLREWLEITGYHNAPYRDKILDRRRRIAELDALKAKLVQEMQVEERGPIPGPPSSAMMPPPVSNKAGGQADTLPISTSTADIPHDQLISNKRPYSDVQSPRENTANGKIARTDERSRGPRAKEDEDNDRRRPRSGGFDSGRRASFDPRDPRDDRSPKYDSRGRSRDRDTSPGRRPYDGRSGPRNRSYEPESFRDQDDVPERANRQYEVRGNYRGRGFDPNFRSRGRGRGRGDARDTRDSREHESGYGSRIANSKPYKDTKGFDKGGKGDTRYFIVKSFNEENVLRCITDSIWTTQVQNGGIFKEAFETCKNVILVFSINKSRAFQGYARMESLPGSVEVPDWQRAINWESAGAFKVKWLVICATRFSRIGHLKNALNDNQAVLIGKDGQEIEERCGASLIELIDEEVGQAIERDRRFEDDREFEWGRERDHDCYP